jgi:hypothetical protein
MSDTAAVVGAALAGAVVGGAATGVGAYFVGRTQRRHDARVNLYLDLLPELKTSRTSSFRMGGDGGRSKTAITHEIVRVANVAGGRAISFARALSAAVEAIERPFTDAELKAAPSVGAGSMKRIDRSSEKESLDRAVADLNAWLERKLKGGPKSLFP